MKYGQLEGRIGQPNNYIESQSKIIFSALTEVVRSKKKKMILMFFRRLRDCKSANVLYTITGLNTLMQRSCDAIAFLLL